MSALFPDDIIINLQKKNLSSVFLSRILKKDTIRLKLGEVIVLNDLPETLKKRGRAFRRPLVSVKGQKGKKNIIDTSRTNPSNNPEENSEISRKFPKSQKINLRFRKNSNIPKKFQKSQKSMTDFSNLAFLYPEFTCLGYD